MTVPNMDFLFWRVWLLHTQSSSAKFTFLSTQWQASELPSDCKHTLKRVQRSRPSMKAKVSASTSRLADRKNEYGKQSGSKAEATKLLVLAYIPSASERIVSVHAGHASCRFGPQTAPLEAFIYSVELTGCIEHSSAFTCQHLLSSFVSQVRSESQADAACSERVCGGFMRLRVQGAARDCAGKAGAK